MSKAGVFLSSKSQVWATNQEFFDKINKIYKFTLDPCAHPDTAKCKKYFTEEDNGLIQSWKGYRVFANPPFKNVDEWIEKAVQENVDNNVFIYLFIKARVDTKTYHKYFWDYEMARARPGVTVNFLPKRMVYGSDAYWEWLWEQEFREDGKPNTLYKKYGKKNAAPFPSMSVVLHERRING